MTVNLKLCIISKRWYFMKENRYFQMIYLLLEKGNMTAPELAEHFEVSVRTIYRDIDILSSAGIPIYATQGKGGGISIQNNFVLNKSILSEKEQEQILIALQGSRVIEEDSTNTLLLKLGSMFQQENINWFEFDFQVGQKPELTKKLFIYYKVLFLKVSKFHFIIITVKVKPSNE